MANKKSSKIGLKTQDGHPCSWLYVISSTKRASETKIGMAKLDLIERYKNLSTADPNLYIYGAFLIPKWYFGKTVRSEEIMWHDFFAEPKPLIAYGDFSNPTVRLCPPAAVSSSIRLPKHYGGESEWFAVQPEAAFNIMSEYISAAKSSKATLGNMNAIESVDPSDKFVFNEVIFVYTQDALFWEFDKSNYIGPVGGALPSKI